MFLFAAQGTMSLCVVIGFHKNNNSRSEKIYLHGFKASLNYCFFNNALIAIETQNIFYALCAPSGHPRG